MTTEFPGPGPTGSVGRIVIREPRTMSECLRTLEHRGLSLRGVTWAPGVDITTPGAVESLAAGLNHYLDGDVTELQRLTTEAEG